MAVELKSAKVIVRILAALESGLDLGAVRDEVDQKVTQLFTNGAGADQANALFHDRRTIAASGNESLDLAASLVDGFGRTLTFTKVRALIIVASEGNTNNVVVTRPASNGVPIFAAASDALAPLKPGGMFVLTDPSADGIAVTAGTGDLINIANSGGSTSVTYDVFILGAV